MHVLTLSNGKTFAADSNVSILDAARAGGVTLEHSCRTGRCGVCKASVLAGDTAVLRPEESLTDAERADGIVLTCCRAATSDLALDVEDLDRLAGLEIRTIPARVVSLSPLAPDIMHVVLRTPPASPLRFLPGQYVDVIAEGVRRSYSLANAPRADGLLELLVKRYPGGKLSGFWFERARPNDLLRIEGPLGTFFLRDAAPTHIVFLATGTGIAPVKALLEGLASTPDIAAERRISVFWGNRSAESFCWDHGDLGLDIRLERLLTGPDVTWTGARGYVQDAALRHGVDLADTVVYACGSDTMIASARERLVASGLPVRRFFSDAFVSSS
jgi:CDP-4-dehydro-6-deoxyglucose reductase